ncbi:hypothetical protein CRF12_004917 [Salmonella enterica subsp. enterica serovar Glostrup]|nr:hypothetical protein [Salmonella enterica subsp. enterica serovar Glostrup]EEH2441334.1 hypothetical protein [Salmonella enterica]
MKVLRFNVMLASWLLGFLASWLLGFLASWLLGFLASWLLGQFRWHMMIRKHY